MEETAECRVRNVHEWQCLLNLISEEEKKTDRTAEEEVVTMKYYLHNSQIRATLNEWLRTMYQSHARVHGVNDSAVKCDELSLWWRRKGNELYTKPGGGELEAAYDSYQMSVLLAKPDGPMMPVALSNRSAVLARLKRYKECLADVEWALQLGFPEKQTYRLHLRRADCYVELGFEKEARQSIQDTLDSVSKGILSSTSMVEVEASVKQIEQKLRSTRIVGRDEVRLPPLLNGPNKTFEHASKAVKLVRGDERVGRHVQTRQEAELGDVLFSEEPYACVALPGAGTICQLCCVTGVNLVPCKVCTRVGYCSFECRNIGEILFHRWECKGYQCEIFNTIGIAHLGLRTVIMMANEGFPTPMKPSYLIQLRLRLEQARTEEERSEIKALFVEAISTAPPPHKTVHLPNIESSDDDDYKEAASFATTASDNPVGAISKTSNPSTDKSPAKEHNKEAIPVTTSHSGKTLNTSDEPTACISIPLAVQVGKQDSPEDDRPLIDDNHGRIFDGNTQRSGAIRNTEIATLNKPVVTTPIKISLVHQVGKEGSHNIHPDATVDAFNHLTGAIRKTKISTNDTPTTKEGNMEAIPTEDMFIPGANIKNYEPSMSEKTANQSNDHANASTGITDPVKIAAFKRIKSIVQQPAACDEVPDSNRTYSASALKALENRGKGLDENGVPLRHANKIKVEAGELFASYLNVDNVKIYRPEIPPMYRMFNLTCNYRKMSNVDFSQYCVTAAALTHYLDQYTSFFAFLPHQLPYEMTDTQQREFVAAILLRSICQLICNGHAAYSIISENRSETEVRRATAIYPTTAMMNHSCDPDIITNFYKTRLIVRCARDLPAGATVSNCYGPHYARHTHDERFRELRAQYGFYCHCGACDDDQKKDFAKLFSAFACLYCKAPLQPAMTQCPHCKKPVRMELRRDLLDSANEMSRKAHGMSNVASACEFEQAALQNRQKALHRHNSELREHADYVARMYIETGQFAKAIEIFRQNVHSAEYQFGSNSAEVAHELRKLTNVMYKRLTTPGSEKNSHYRDWCVETHAMARKAATRMELNYGHWEPLVKSLQEIESQMEERLAGMRSPDASIDTVDNAPLHYNFRF